MIKAKVVQEAAACLLYNKSSRLCCAKVARLFVIFSSQAYLASAPVFIVSLRVCPYCTKVKAFLNKNR